MHIAAGGLIKTNGGKLSVVPMHDGKARYDGTFTHGESVENAVNAQHIETGTWGVAYISTTTDRAIAERFATHTRSGGRCKGVVYVLDTSLFEQHGVLEVKSSKPRYAGEREVSIAPAIGDTLPAEVVVAIAYVG